MKSLTIAIRIVVHGFALGAMLLAPHTQGFHPEEAGQPTGSQGQELSRLWLANKTPLRLLRLSKISNRDIALAVHKSCIRAVYPAWCGIWVGKFFVVVASTCLLQGSLNLRTER